MRTRRSTGFCCLLLGFASPLAVRSLRAFTLTIMPSSRIPPSNRPHGWMEIWALRQTRPLTYLTFWLNFQLGGDNPVGYHALNLALHLGGGIAALWDCLRRSAAGARKHSSRRLSSRCIRIQAEAVDYVWGRSIVLAALLCFRGVARVAKRSPWRSRGVVRRGAAGEGRMSRRFRWRCCALDRKKRGGPSRRMLALSRGGGGAHRLCNLGYAGSVGGSAGGHFAVAILPRAGPGDLAICAAARLTLWLHGRSGDRGPSVWLGLLAGAILIAAAAWLWRRNSRWFALGPDSAAAEFFAVPRQDLAADRRMYLAIALPGFGLRRSPKVDRRPWIRTCLLPSPLLAVSVAPHRCLEVG